MNRTINLLLVANFPKEARDKMSSDMFGGLCNLRILEALATTRQLSDKTTVVQSSATAMWHFDNRVTTVIYIDNHLNFSIHSLYFMSPPLAVRWPPQ